MWLLAVSHAQTHETNFRLMLEISSVLHRNRNTQIEIRHCTHATLQTRPVDERDPLYLPLYLQCDTNGGWWTHCFVIICIRFQFLWAQHSKKSNRQLMLHGQKHKWFSVWQTYWIKKRKTIKIKIFCLYTNHNWYSENTPFGFV